MSNQVLVKKSRSMFSILITSNKGNLAISIIIAFIAVLAGFSVTSIVFSHSYDTILQFDSLQKDHFRHNQIDKAEHVVIGSSRNNVLKAKIFSFNHSSAIANNIENTAYIKAFINGKTCAIFNITDNQNPTITYKNQKLIQFADYITKKFANDYEEYDNFNIGIYGEGFGLKPDIFGGNSLLANCTGFKRAIWDDINIYVYFCQPNACLTNDLTCDNTSLERVLYKSMACKPTGILTVG